LWRGPQSLDVDEVTARRRGLERAVLVAAERVGGPSVAEAREVLARASERVALSPDLTVVALAGSTGAGKSSLFNALVGEPVATVAVTRPTTDRPTAGLWTESPRASALLEWLAVPRAHSVQVGPDDPLTGLVLLDLPDHDSTATDHREQVDRIVARADVMVWVLDPQKYADALVHDSYLAQYARHAETTVVVLNQIDRLSAPDGRACLAHLRGLVAADGLPGTQVLGVSARTGAGLDEVRTAVGDVVARRQAALQRLAADIGAAADALSREAGDQGAPLAAPPTSVLRRLPEAMADAAGVPLIERSVAESVKRSGTLRTGWPPVRWIARLRRDPAARLHLGREGVDPRLVRTSLPSASPVSQAEVTAAARDYARVASAGCPPPWVRSSRAIAVTAAEAIGPHLDAAVARAEVRAPRQPLWWRLVAGMQWFLLGAALVGLLWLLGLVLLQALALVAPEPPTVGVVPVPTLLLMVGVSAGLLLALLARWASAVTARRAAARARAAVVTQLEELARVRIVEPVDAEVATLAEFRLGVLAAHGS
jgi:GTP-binding protein EngB required for normal cell division